MWNYEYSKCQFLPRLLGYVLPGQQPTNERSHAPSQHRYDTNRHDLIGHEGDLFESWSNMFRLIRCRFLFVFYHVLSKCWKLCWSMLILIFSWKKQLDLKGWGICMTAWPTKMASHEIHFWEGVNLSRWIVQWWFSTFYQITWEPRTTRIQFIQFHFADDFVGSNFDPYPQVVLQTKGDRIMAKSSALAGNRFRTVKHWAANPIFRWF